VEPNKGSRVKLGNIKCFVRGFNFSGSTLSSISPFSVRGVGKRGKGSSYRERDEAFDPFLSKHGDPLSPQSLSQ